MKNILDTLKAFPTKDNITFHRWRVAVLISAYFLIFHSKSLNFSNPLTAIFSFAVALIASFVFVVLIDVCADAFVKKEKNA